MRYSHVYGGRLRAAATGAKISSTKSNKSGTPPSVPWEIFPTGPFGKMFNIKNVVGTLPAWREGGWVDSGTGGRIGVRAGRTHRRTGQRLDARAVGWVDVQEDRQMDERVGENGGRLSDPARTDGRTVGAGGQECGDQASCRPGRVDLDVHADTSGPRVC